MRDAETSNRVLDKLVRVRRLNGSAQNVLTHIEVQGDRVTTFEHRMFTCMYRVHDFSQLPVVGMAVLTDMENNWRPEEYRQDLWGTWIHYRFHTAKLLDWEGREAELEASDNMFAVVVQVQLVNRHTRGHVEDRYQARWSLVRRLYERQFSRIQVVDLLRFMDWVMVLPPELNQKLQQEIMELEEEKKMPYLSSFERMSMEKGRQEGQQSTLLDLLHDRFGAVPEWVSSRITGADYATLRQWTRAILTAPSIDAIFADKVVAQS
jgi:hypothetical protein